MSQAPEARAQAGGGEQGEQLLALACEAARVAGERLRERFLDGGTEGVRSKSTPTDLVSDADLEAQRTIRTLIAARRPGDEFIGEEEEGPAENAVQPGGALPLLGRPRAGGDHPDAVAWPVPGAGSAEPLRWVVDPLDGTVNFLFGIPQWCVSVAVQDAAGRTLAGAILDPNRDELFTAFADGPARLNGKALHCSEKRDLASAMVATGFYYDAAVRSVQAEVLERLIGEVRDIRRLGSAALDLAWTAAGRYDAYFERGVKLWDIAAGALICERAGVSVIELPARRGPGTGPSSGRGPGRASGSENVSSSGPEIGPEFGPDANQDLGPDSVTGLPAGLLACAPALAAQLRTLVG